MNGPITAFAAVVIAALITAFALQPSEAETRPPHTQPTGRVGTTASGPGNGLEGVREAMETVGGYVAAVETQRTANAAEAALVASQAAGGSQAPSTGAVAPPADSSGLGVWECIHEKEGNPWHGGTPGYPGGLGILAEATDNYRRQIDPSFPIPSESASPEQQVMVARWVLGYAGPSAWATASLCGLQRGM